jgi:hypothetical protein
MRASIVATGLVAVLVAGCELRSTPAAGERQGTAEPLGMFGTALPENTEDQAYRALEQDAFRREHRFLDAVSPGHLARATDLREADVAAGLWTPDEVFQIGAQLFHLTFTPSMGYGGADQPPLGRFHNGRRGGPDAMVCASCHWRGGPAGAGDGADNAYLDGDGDRQSSALARNPPALPGAGLVELLAAEMTADLHTQRDVLLAAAKAKGASVAGELVTKGVRFGTLVARPDGLVDVTGVEGVDADLTVKPFGWKGNLRTIRDVVEDSLLVHHGMQSTHLVATAGPDRLGPFGGEDPDGDGVANEITEGQVAALSLFVAMQEVPVLEPPTEQDFLAAWAVGQQRFAEIGCADCHVPSLPLRSTRFVLASRTGQPAVTIDLAEHGGEPRIARGSDGSFALFLFSDLKRHDLGPALAEPRPDRGALAAQFLTRPLWGVARSRPYLHDARAPTLEDAILLHGGEAQASRDAYEALAEVDRAPIRVFLTSMTRARRIVAQ